MDNVIGAFTAVATAIVGLAIISVIVSRNSDTKGVVSAVGNVYTSALGIAVSPVSQARPY